MSIWTDPKFQERVRQALIKASEFMESEAECLRESCTSPHHDGEWDEECNRLEYEREMKQVDEMADILRMVFDEPAS